MSHGTSTFKLTEQQDQLVREWARTASAGAVWTDDRGVTATVQERDADHPDVLVAIRRGGVLQYFMYVPFE